MKKRCVLLLVALMFVYVGLAMADNLPPAGDPALYLSTNASDVFGGGVLNSGSPIAVTSLSAFPSESTPESAPSSSGFLEYTNDTGATIKTLYVFAPVVTGYTIPPDGNLYGCGYNLAYSSGGIGNSTANCTSFYDSALTVDGSTGAVVFEYFGLDITSGTGTSTDNFYIGSGGEPTGYWNGENMYLASTPEPSSLVLFGSGLLALAGFARRRFLK